jgi:hypothetical protein
VVYLKVLTSKVRTGIITGDRSSIGVELKPFTFGFYSGSSPARGLIASALLDKSLKDRYGGRVPVRGVAIVDRADADMDKLVGRTLEALSNAGVDVPPARVINAGPGLDVDAYVLFTRYEDVKSAGGRPVYFLEDLAGLPGHEVDDTFGDFSQLVPVLSDMIARALPSMLLMSRYKHMGDITMTLADLVERYRSAHSKMSNQPKDFSAAAASVEVLENLIFGLAAPDGPIRKYAEAYGNVCMCGGTMQLVSERYRDGIYELTFTCNRCGRKVTRYH